MRADSLYEDVQFRSEQPTSTQHDSGYSIPTAGSGTGCQSSSVRQFESDGFALAKFETKGDFSAATEECKEMHRLARGGWLRDTRVEDDFPHILGGMNVWGVEDPFAYSVYLGLPDAITYSNIGRLLTQYAGWSGADLELVRLHCGTRFKHQGFWHVDAPLSNYYDSIVAIIYMMPESGFRILPYGFLPHGNLTPPENEQIISALAGDVLLMRSALHHKGYFKPPRLHLHMRFKRNDAAGYDQRKWSQWHPKKDAPKHQRAPMGRQWKNLARYLMPGGRGSNIWQ